MRTPYFSIVVPVYNRAKFVARTLGSCFSQDFDDFEIIVVDDGSTENSVAVVRELRDPRLSIIEHGTNRGVCPARNTGISAATGDWILCLDSDDELVPGALSTVARRADVLSPEVGSIWFRCRWDSGVVSPDPPLEDELAGYAAYLRFVEEYRGRPLEALPVVRRSTFAKVRYPDSPFGMEFLYHLRMSRQFLTRRCSDIVRLYHQDADNRLCDPSAGRVRALANARVESYQTILQEHGSDLRKFAPTVYRDTLRALATNQFLARNRRAGLRCSFRLLDESPFSLNAWAVLVLGLAGPGVLEAARTIRSSLRPRHASRVSPPTANEPGAHP